MKLKAFDRLIHTMQNLKIKDLEELAEIYRIAIEIRKETPVSF